MPVDNEIYNRLSSTWWDEQGFLNLLRTAVNPGRFGYFREVLLKQVGVDPVGKQALDVGCGGGLLAEEYLAEVRSEEHTSELQSHLNLVCRLLLEKKKICRTKARTQ